MSEINLTPDFFIHILSREFMEAVHSIALWNSTSHNSLNTYIRGVEISKKITRIRNNNKIVYTYYFLILLRNILCVFNINTFECGCEVHYFRSRKSSRSHKQEEIAIGCARESNCRPPRPSRLIILIWLRFISTWWFVCSRSFVSIYGISPSNRPIRSV